MRAKIEYSDDQQRAQALPEDSFVHYDDPALLDLVQRRLLRCNRNWLIEHRPECISIEQLARQNARLDELVRVENQRLALDPVYQAQIAEMQKQQVAENWRKDIAEHERGQRKQKAYRDRQRLAAEVANPTPALASGDAPAAIDWRYEARRLKHWLTQDGPRQRQLRPRATDIMHGRIAIVLFRAAHGREPKIVEFAALVTGRIGRSVTKASSQHRLKIIRELEGPDGPWRPDPARKEVHTGDPVHGSW